MTEYWKSTPKYWCKHCKTFVRDTPLEKNNHELTPRHQGALKRFLRDLHRDNEAAARDRQRAKDEAARLNGSAPAGGGEGGSGARPTAAGGAASSLRNATPDERRRQMAQLADMGVRVPDAFRRENAMAGDWEVVAQQVVAGADGPGAQDPAGVKRDEDQKDVVSVGVRKRRPDEADAEAEQARVRRKKWGSDVRALPGEKDDDLDALLGVSTGAVRRKPVDAEDMPIKKEESPGADGGSAAPKAEDPLPTTTTPEAAEEPSDVRSLFKKRKPRGKRQEQGT